MQCSERSEKEIAQIGEVAAKYPIDVLYFADSMGGMNAKSDNSHYIFIKIELEKTAGDPRS